MQSVTTHLPGFGTGGPADSQWWKEQQEIADTLRDAAKSAHDKKKVSAARLHEYNMSGIRLHKLRGLSIVKITQLYNKISNDKL